MAQKCEKILGIKIDNKSILMPHVRSLCKKTSQKLNAFARVECSLKFEQKKVLLYAFATMWCSYSPVVLMFYDQKLNNHINHIHERALRIVYQNQNLTFD